MLLGKAGPNEYGGIICDRDDGSYVFLQRLVTYNPPNNSIWKIVEIQTLPKLKADEVILSEGCEHIQGHEQPIFAVVREHNNASAYQTLKAWTVNLADETFRPVQASQVVCSDPFTLTEP